MNDTTNPMNDQVFNALSPILAGSKKHKSMRGAVTFSVELTQAQYDAIVTLFKSAKTPAPVAKHETI